MDEKPQCSRTLDIDPIQPQPKKKDQSENQKDLQILPEEQTPVTKTQTVLIEEVPASSEVESSPKIQTALTEDQHIYLIEQTNFSKDKPGFSGDQTAFSEDQPSHSKDQPDNSKDQPTFSKTLTVDKLPYIAKLRKIYINVSKDGSASSRELIAAMNSLDEAEPSLSYTLDIDPIHPQPAKKDRSENQKDLQILPEGSTPATKTQTVLIKEAPVSSEVETSSEIQTALTEDQHVYLIEQTNFSKDQPGFSGDQTSFSEDQPSHSKDQPDNSKDQPTFSKTQTVDKPAFTAKLTKIYINLSKDGSASSRELIAAMNSLDEAKPSLPNTLDIDPIHPQPTKKDRSENQKDLQILPEESTPATKTQTVIIKEVPVSSEVETSPEIQTALTEDQHIYLIEQTNFSKDQPGFSGDKTFFSEDQPTHSKDQPDNSKDQPTFSKTQTVDKSALTAKLRKIYINLSKDGSREFIAAINSLDKAEASIQISKRKGESSISKEQKTLIITKHSAATAALSFNINKDHFISTYVPFKITSSTQSPKINKPKSQFPATTVTLPSVGTPGQPPSLFLQALSKLNESSLALAILPFGLQSSPNFSKICNRSGDITPPDSLSSAPPTYSFVLRQMAVRRRPRFMGTFFPSPSFVQHAPPPAYTGAFDVYIEPALPPPPVRVYSFGFTSMPVVCTECGFTGMTIVKSRITICTHLCAITLCLLCCWLCAPLPYILSSCKDVYHYCSNCRTFLGMYCPTNPEAGYPVA